MLLHESANMEQSAPENLSTHVFNCEKKLQPAHYDPTNSENSLNSISDLPTKELVTSSNPTTSAINLNTLSTITSNNSSSSNTTKVKLSFSVDRLLGAEHSDPTASLIATSSRQCCDGSVYACCTFPNCFGQVTEAATHTPVTAPQALTEKHAYIYAGLDKFYPGLYMDYKSVLRPTPIRAAEHATFPTLATNALLRFHQQQQQHHQQHLQQSHAHKSATLLHSPTSATALLAPLNSLKSLHLTQQQRFLAKNTQQQLLDIPTTATGVAGSAQNGMHIHNTSNMKHSNISSSNNVASNNSNNNNNNNNGKRKRSWSRAVFTNLQRKGLEIQFQQQKYITKPDRRKLAARLNLTDAQVKVWFQNRRMKWRHTRENLKSGHEKQPQPQLSSGSTDPSKPLMITAGVVAAPLDYSSDSCSSIGLSERADDDDNIEIDVVE